MLITQFLNQPEGHREPRDEFGIRAGNLPITSVHAFLISNAFFNSDSVLFNFLMN